MSIKIKPVLVVVDLSILQSSPAGSCVLSEIIGLVEDYDVHVFTTELDLDLAKHVTLHQLSAPRSPLVLRYMVFSAKANRAVTDFVQACDRPVMVQSTQGQYVDCTVSYPHFSHKAYLSQHWENNPISGITRLMRKMNHVYNARSEARAFKKAQVIVTPSEGLKREITNFYPKEAAKIKVIANPVDVDKFKRSQTFDVEGFRRSLGFLPSDVVIGFAALGDFERKGLPILMQAVADLDEGQHPFKILVIGGKEGEIASYKAKAKQLNLVDRILFTGFRKNVEQYLWCCQIFSLPSIYEIFPLVAVQAAASGLPLLITALYGVEEYIANGVNGWTVSRDAQSIAAVLREINEGRYDLDQMGEEAFKTVLQYDHRTFRAKWLALYQKHLNFN